MPTTDPVTNTADMRLEVTFLASVPGVPVADLEVDRVETMAYGEYLELSASELAFTRVKFLDNDEKEVPP